MQLSPHEFKVSAIPLECLDLIRRKEGKRLTAYNDPIGIPSIGYGHTRGVTAEDVRIGRQITDAQAEAYLFEDLEGAVSILRNSVTVPLTPYQLGALTSFVYNVGSGRAAKAGDRGKDGFVTLKSGRPSTMRARLNAGDYAGACEQFSKWVYAGGKVMQGLVTRRAEEAVLFSKSMPVNVYTPAPEMPPEPKPAPPPPDTLVKQPSAAPTRKVIAAGSGGIAATFIVKVLWDSIFKESPMPADIAATIGTAIGALAAVIPAYITKSKAGEGAPPAQPDPD